ncbi:MAG TPA: 3'(2'),5'-bisphosphate nucleotidase CysQ [Thermomicrobiales bacterium]|nr:3'(2'),5'-bisphosphate nucleotidase CysQ [Thermomicrobiales bacterium]
MLPTIHPYQRELDVALPLVRETATAVREIYDAQSAETYVKGDGSPVTDADLTADRMLREGLSRAFPDDALLTEESEDDPSRLTRARCWIADPIDGTAQFVARTGDFDILLALTVEGRSELSICAHPPSGTITVAIRNHGAWRVDGNGTVSPFRIAAPSEPPILVASKYYGPEENADNLASVAATLGSEPMPILQVGYGPRAFLPGWRTYDAFVGFWRASGDSPVREWDLAASDLLTVEAGGAFTDLYGNPYQYNQPTPRPRAGLLVSASPELHERLLAALAPLLPTSPPIPASTS